MQMAAPEVVILNVPVVAVLETFPVRLVILFVPSTVSMFIPPPNHCVPDALEYAK